MRTWDGVIPDLGLDGVKGPTLPRCPWTFALHGEQKCPSPCNERERPGQPTSMPDGDNYFVQPASYFPLAQVLPLGPWATPVPFLVLALPPLAV